MRGTDVEARVRSIPFSAFWLRSSVVSVLISLISDTWDIVPHDIKFIFLGGGSITVACCWDPQASPLRCTTAWAWRAPPILQS
ncbi:Protein kinase superfamily protein [Melia azedarach]|uniref:Protein kinase superfamily protein n=1 Tax=Melia azedarach TaxID=155640 RepID=A0ACC1YYA4_MELAZ|nr:Protein kinase superfamily protein [Melia azedarach]